MSRVCIQGETETIKTPQQQWRVRVQRQIQDLHLTRRWGEKKTLQNYFKSPGKKFPLDVAKLRNKCLMTKTLWLLEIVLFYLFIFSQTLVWKKWSLVSDRKETPACDGKLFHSELSWYSRIYFSRKIQSWTFPSELSWYSRIHFPGKSSPGPSLLSSPAPPGAFSRKI